jgi:hypothetical protein
VFREPVAAVTAIIGAITIARSAHKTVQAPKGWLGGLRVVSVGWMVFSAFASPAPDKKTGKAPQYEQPAKDREKLYLLNQKRRDYHSQANQYPSEGRYLGHLQV